MRSSLGCPEINLMHMCTNAHSLYFHWISAPNHSWSSLWVLMLTVSWWQKRCRILQHWHCMEPGQHTRYCRGVPRDGHRHSHSQQFDKSTQLTTNRVTVQEFKCESLYKIQILIASYVFCAHSFCLTWGQQRLAGSLTTQLLLLSKLWKTQVKVRKTLS